MGRSKNNFINLLLHRKIEWNGMILSISYLSQQTERRNITEYGQQKRADNI